MMDSCCWPLKLSCVVNWRVVVLWWLLSHRNGAIDPCAEAVAVLVRTQSQERTVCTVYSVENRII